MLFFLVALEALQRYEVDRLFYHFARSEQEKKSHGSPRVVRAAWMELRKVVVLGSGWGALSFVRKLDPSAFDVTCSKSTGSLFEVLLNSIEYYCYLFIV